MGDVVAGGAVGLTDEQYRAHGIEDYAAEFSQADDTKTDVFAGLLNQETSLERFVESLALDVRGRLNLGDAGVGKTTCVQALFSALEKLDRGEEITGPYAEQIQAYHRERHSHPRGEIIALWNPDDYYKPIFFRGSDSNPETSLEDVLKAKNMELVDDLCRKSAEIVYHSLLHQQALEQLSTSYRIREREKGDTLKIQWTLPRKKSEATPLNYTETTPRGARTYWNREVRSAILELTRTIPRKTVVDAVRTILSRGKEVFENEQEYRKTLRADAEKQLDSIIESWTEDLVQEGSNWDAREPAIGKWYRSVATFLREKRNRVSLVESIWDASETRMAMRANASRDKKKKRRSGSGQLGELNPYHISLEVAGEEYPLIELLEPSKKREAAGKTLIIRSPTVQEPIELFFNKEGNEYLDEDAPIHRQVVLGELAYADILFLDDGIAEILAEKKVRQALLTYLSEGRISVDVEKVQLDCNSHCHLFACDTEYPFFRQIYEGTVPDVDEGMARRFAVTEWSRIAKHDTGTVAAFPAIVKKMTKDIRSVKSDDAITFSPEALNLIYQHLIGQTEPTLLFPLAVGQMSKELLQPIAARVGGQGRNIVAGDDVRAYLDSRRSEIKLIEEYFVDSSFRQHPFPRASTLVGHANGLYAGSAFGGAFHLTASVTDSFSGLVSADATAKLTEETFHKGIVMTDEWIRRNFGPLRIGVRLSNNDFSQMGGPSSSAVNTYASISALGDIPIDQNTYVTGTVLDLEGNVGVIGGVFEKTRGAIRYHRKRFEGNEMPPMRVLIPTENVREFLRQTLLDQTVADALRDGSLEVRTHADIWDGFTQLSGLPREEWEPRVRERIANATERIAQFEASLKALPRRRERTGRRVWR